MKIEEAKQRILELKKEINYHNKNYYQFNAPEISDFEYDVLMNDLIAIERSFPSLITADSPTQVVGSDIIKDSDDLPKEELVQTEFKQYPHKYPMLSLGNTYDFNELYEFNQRIEKAAYEPFTYSCELKFDGTAICLTYINGILSRALTRGDGSIGDDVSINVKQIPSIPQILNSGSNFPAEFEIRGEIFMPFKSFDKLNKQRELDEMPTFANPRNAAAGSLKLLDSKEIKHRGLECKLYHPILPDNLYLTHIESLKAAETWGLPISEYTKECKSIDEVILFIKEWDHKRSTLPYPTDGIVIKVNQLSLQKSLGYTSKFPRWATAYKFKPEEALTELLSVDFQVGRTGAITPVANLSPVQLSGTIVKRATLHNADQIEALDIHIGDFVYVEKGGEIIPKITRVETKNRISSLFPIKFPDVCPDCGTPLVKDEALARHYCPNYDNCPQQIKGRFLHFIGRKAMNINAGEATIEQLFNKGFIKDLKDLYTLSDQQLLSLDKFKEKSVDNYRNSLELSKKIPFSKVLFALGIKYIGEATAKLLVKEFKNIDNLIAASKEELSEINEIGETIAESLYNYFRTDKNINNINKLRELGLQFVDEMGSKIKISEVLNGKTVMITGNFSISREKMKELIEAYGGKVGSSISSNTDFMIVGQKAGGSKLEKANKLNIETISEDEFYKRIN